MRDSDCPRGRCTLPSGYCDDAETVTTGGGDAGPDAAPDAAPDARDVVFDVGPDVVDVPLPDAADVVDVPGMDAASPTPARGFVLLYNNADGAAVFGGIASDGLFFPIQTLTATDLGAGWTHVLAATRSGSGSPLQVLLYNRTTNMHVLRYFTPTGIVRPAPALAPLAPPPSATHMSLSTTGFLLATNQMVGTPPWEARLVFPSVSSIGTPFGSSGWTVNDSTRLVLTATHNGSFLAYSSFSGNAMHGGYTSSGAQIMGMRQNMYPTGFTHIVPTTTDDVLLYNAATNGLAVMYAPASGTGAAIMGTDTYPRPSGTSPASHVTSTDGGTVVFYRSFQGDLDVGTSSRVAPFTRLRTTAGFGGYTQIVGF